MTTTTRPNPSHQLFRDFVRAERRRDSASGAALPRLEDEVIVAMRALHVAYFGGIGDPRREDKSLLQEFREALKVARAAR